jgi:1-acyl-sn-glycerol-3-phosphate acyltransferase
LTAIEATLDPREKKSFSFQATPFRKFLVGSARLLFGLFMQLEVHGLQYFPMTGPVIVAANHVTNYDPFPMQFSLPRPIFYMGKASLFKFPVMDIALRNLGAFPVYRGEKDAWALLHARRILDHGQVLGMFPEGTRSKGRGLGVAKTGAARLALESNSLISPMTIIGTDKFFHNFPRRITVKIQILAPLQPNKNETPLALTDRLMFALAAALPENKRGAYAKTPAGFN